MTDDAMLAAFAGGELDPAAFRHREHVRTAWLHLGRYGRVEAERRMLDGLRTLALRAGRAERFDAALSLAWMAAIDAARLAHPECATFDDFIAAAPELLDPRAVPAG